MSELGHLASTVAGGTRTFRLTGEFDLSNAWEVEGALLDAIRGEGGGIVVDLSGVVFMDAQLVRVLVAARAFASRNQVEFVVIPPANPTAGRVAQLIDFDIAA
jgi:anti-anti-sigma factor